MYRFCCANVRHVSKSVRGRHFWILEQRTLTSGITKEAVTPSEGSNTAAQSSSTKPAVSSQTSTTTVLKSTGPSQQHTLLPGGVAPVAEPSADVELPLPYIEREARALLDVAKQREEALRLASPFDEMPGPPILKHLARAWSFLPQISNQITAAAMAYFMNMLGRIDDPSQGGATLMWNRAAAPFVHMFDKYGPVVRLQGIFGGDIVFVARPEHIQTVYKEEGKYPLRSALDSLQKYRMERRSQSIAGPFVLFGPEWETIRKKMEVSLVQSVSLFGPQLEVIADEFVENVKSLLNRQEEVPADFNKEIFKWALESVALATLGKRMYCVGPNKLLPGSVGFGLLDAVQKASDALRWCESGFQTWRLVGTPSWKNLANACEAIDGVVLKFIRETEHRLHSDRLGTHADSPANLKEAQTEGNTDSKPKDPTRQVSLVEALLLDGQATEEDVLTVALDVLLLGTNATAHALSFLLYRLSKCPRAQRELFEELSTSVTQPHSRLTPLYSKPEAEDAVQFPYLKACLRESLRMNPPIPVLTRILPRDIALHNYRIPRGTVVLMASHVTGLKEENFDDAKKFIPERWLKEDFSMHPFAALPYGHGPRSCVARHLADMQLLIMAAKIFRNFSVEYNYGVMQPSNGLIALPNKPLKFQFVERL